MSDATSRQIWLVRLWDGLAVLLIVAWAGAFHIDPALRDFAPPKERSLAAVALLAAFAGALQLWARVSLNSSLVLSAGAWLFRRWHALIVSRTGLTLTLSTMVIAVVWAMSSLRRHWALGSNSFDLGIYTNGLWNLIHGFGYTSSLKGGMHLFGDHQTPTYWLVAPLFQLWPQPELLLILQAVAYATTGAALALLAAQYGGSSWWGTAAMPLLYWNYLPARNANAFDVRPDSFMLPLFCWAIVGLHGRRLSSRLAGGAAMLLAIGCKETAAMVAATVGIAWLLGAGPADTRLFTRKLGAALVVLATVAFYVDTSLVPGLVGETYAYSDLYSHYGPGAIDVALAPITSTREFFRQLTQPAAFNYLLWTLAPLAFLPALDWCAWLISAPAYLSLFLVNTPYRIDIAFQYSNEISVGLFWALTRVLPRIDLVPARALQIWTVAWALAASGGSDILRLRHYSPTFHSEWIRHDLAPAIGPTLAVAASDALVPHLATRHWVDNLRRLSSGSDEPVDCIITDNGVNDSWINPSDLDVIVRGALSRGYQLEFFCGGVKIVSRPDRPCLRRPLQCPI